MQEPITVSALNNQIKTLLESTFLSVYVEGEVSRVTYHRSGHLYFTLKDEESAISCVMFRGNNRYLKFRLEEGMKVLVSGAISVFVPRGGYQINCFSIEPYGIGSLALAYEQLKKRLEAKGYFDMERKKPLKKYPDKIVLVTSKTGAAIEDMLKVASKRWPLVKIILIDTLVQGEGAAEEIAKNIKIADSLNADVIVIGRGGGSLEDLWAFNEEIVADAVYEAETPIVSAVGHEIDTLISDYVADLRAPTPSAAMEMILPDINEEFMNIDSLFQDFDDVMDNIFHKKEQVLSHLFALYKQNSLISKIELFKEEIKSVRERFDTYIDFVFERKRKECEDLKRSLNEAVNGVFTRKSDQLLSLKRSLENNDPSKRSKRGFAQIVRNGKITALKELSEGDEIELQDAFASVTASVNGVKKF